MTHPLLRAAPSPAASAPSAADRTAALEGQQALELSGLEPFGLVISGLERTAMLRDRLTRPLLGELCSPALAPVTRLDRADALRALLPQALLDHAVLHRTTAAWFLSCSPAPQRLQLMVHRQRRTTMRPVDPGSGRIPWEVRQLLHEPQDVDRLHGILVTTPTRTAADLACWDDPASFPALCRVLGAPHLGAEPQAVVDLLRSRSRLPGQKRGVMAVRRAARQLGLPVPR